MNECHHIHQRRRAIECFTCIYLLYIPHISLQPKSLYNTPMVESIIKGIQTKRNGARLLSTVSHLG